MEEHADTRALILDAVQQLARTQDYNAFSYADIARFGIRKAGIHYHFPSKSALGRELILRYRTRFHSSLSLISEINGSVCVQAEKVFFF